MTIVVVRQHLLGTVYLPKMKKKKVDRECYNSCEVLLALFCFNDCFENMNDIEVV